MQKEEDDLKVHHVTTAASTFFGKTTGASPQIGKYYQSLSPSFLNQPLNQHSVDELVTGENNAIKQSQFKDRTTSDWFARLATPFRRVVAHQVAMISVGKDQYLDKYANMTYPDDK